MLRGDLIIDGYNVLHAANLASRLDRPGGLEQGRRALLRLLAGKLTLRERCRTTVVFDAPESLMGTSPPKQIDDLLVMFADRDGDADATIERLIQQNSAPRRLCVVSSDHRLQKAARRRRARFFDSDVFLARLARRSSRNERRPENVEPAAKRSGGLPPGEVEAWLRVFEDVESVRFPSDGYPRVGRTPNASGSPPRSAAPDRHGDSGNERPHQSPENLEDSHSDPIDETSFWESRISELDGE